MANDQSRLTVLKTFKLYIGGKFPRTESGRYLIAKDSATGEHLANYCQASRKDMDINAVIDASGDPAVRQQLQEGVAHNLKRIAHHSLDPKAWSTPAADDPYRILDTLEFKTAWHPIGL